MKPSALTRRPTKAPDPLSYPHAIRVDGGVHWCGWQPSRFEIDVVANRVCPWKTCGASIASPTPWKAAARLRSHARRRITSADRSVRLPFTTRERTPRRDKKPSRSRVFAADAVRR